MSSEITIPAVLVLPEGMVGLPDVQTLDTTLIAGGQFVELVAREEPALGWLACAAEDIRPGMTAELAAAGRIPEDAVLLVLMASHGEPAVVTANLAGPLSVGPDGETRQLVLEGADYPVQARVGRLAPDPIESR